MNSDATEDVSPSSVRQDLIYSLVLLVPVLVIGGGVLFSDTSFIYNLDIDYFYAHEQVLRDSFSKGEFPLWNPYFGGGAPSLSKIQIGIFYPPLILLRAILPPVPMFNWDLVLHLYLAGLGVYWLLRDWRVEPLGGAFAAMTFMLSGAFMPRVFAGHVSVIHSISWTAWLLLAYRRMLLRRTWRWLLLFAIFAGLTFLGGHPQMSLIVFFVPLGYALLFVVVQARKRDWRSIATAAALSAGAAFLTLGLVAVQLIPFVEWLLQTSRGQGEAGVVTRLMTRDSLYPHQLFSLFFPYLWVDVPRVLQEVDVGGQDLFWEKSPYVGLVTLILVGMRLSLGMRHRRWRRRTRYLIALAVFGLAMSMGSINPFYLILARVAPYFRAPGRFLLLWSFGLSVLAGVCLHQLRQPADSRQADAVATATLRLWRWVALFMLALAPLWYVAGRTFLQWLGVPGWIQDFIVAGFTHSINTGIVVVGVIYFLLWLAGTGRIGLRSWSYLAVAVAFVELLIFAVPLIRPQPEAALRDPVHPLAQLGVGADEVRIDGKREPPNYLVPTLQHVTNGEEHKALDSLLDLSDDRGVKYLAAGYRTSEELLEDENLVLVRNTGSAYLYRERDTLPRIYAAPAIEVVRSDEEALDSISARSFEAMRKSVVTLPPSAPLPEALESLHGSQTATPAFEGRFTDYASNTVRAEVETDAPVLVVFSEMYDPGWTATVDGEPVEVWKANYAFRGVLVKPGRHHIEMRFVYPSFRLGLRITVGAILLTIALSLLLAGRRIIDRQSPSAGKAR
ncbi:MAG: YfhO family protein [Chloroflexota bacterium]